MPTGSMSHTRLSAWRVVSPRLCCHSLSTEQSPYEGLREIVVRPEAIKALMDFDSNFFMSPQLMGQASGKFGCLLLSMKAHKLCPQVPLNSISVLRGFVCACVTERGEKKKKGQRVGDGETLPIVQAKKYGHFSSATPSVWARIQPTMWTHNHTLTYSQLVKGVYVYLNQNGEEIIDDKTWALWSK